MIFEFKNITIEETKFTIKYLTSVEDYQLKNSNNRIAIGVFYYPDKFMSMTSAEMTIHKYSLLLRKEIDIIIEQHNNFYNTFVAKDNFSKISTQAGFFAINTSATLYLEQKIN
ncbi:MULTISPECIES: hypothetical protein [Flavobacterium]|uniref:Uncharacterized protein n=1 Tax=Flavobacterium jumunjinense TaxID=998845 RepID=A0ABV5GJF6_9FLAO|nr:MULTISPECIES: hypothetical protein [Flavobacterium]